MKTIVFTGGGTAGHVTPNLSIIEKLKNEYKIHYIGSKNGIEKEIISKYPYIKYHEITTVKLVRKLILKNLLIPFKLVKGIKESKQIMREIKPNIVFSKGGFVSVPVAYSAKSLNIPIIAHESDYTMGLANKLIYNKCNVMCFSFYDTYQNYQEKGLFTGTPLRTSILHGNKEKIRKEYNLNPNLPTILFFGGSLGAVAINNVVFEIASDLTKKYNVLHIVGKSNKNTKLNIKNYHQIEFASNIEDYFAIADIIVSRAGSNSIFELCTLSKPMLLIPLPLSASRGDQILNANYLKNKGLCMVLNQEDLNNSSLKENIDILFKNKSKYISTLKSQPNFNGTDKIISEIKKHSL